MKLYAQHFADCEGTLDIELEFEALVGDIHHAHDPFVHIAIGQAAIIVSRKIRFLAVLAPFFQGDAEVVAANAFALDGDAFIQRRVLGDVDRRNITALRAHKGRRIVVADENLLDHPTISPMVCNEVSSSFRSGVLIFHRRRKGLLHRNLKAQATPGR